MAGKDSIARSPTPALEHLRFERLGRAPSRTRQAGNEPAIDFRRCQSDHLSTILIFEHAENGQGLFSWFSGGMKVFCQDTRRLRVVPHIEERRAGLGRNLFKTRRDAYLSEAGSGGGFRNGKTIEERNNAARAYAALRY